MARPIRSFLFVPADSDKKINKAMQTAADALVLDLEDSVMPSRKALARDTVKELLKSAPADYRGSLWVRINPLTTDFAIDDLCAVVGPNLAGILLPKCAGPHDVTTATNYIDALARKAGLEEDSIGILAVATETAASPFALGDYHQNSLPRLWGLTWGAEDLSSAIGAATNKSSDGNWAFTYRMVRSQCLLAAKASNVQCVETLYADYKNSEGLLSASIEARREGFTGRFAIHPAQVDPINEAFMPSGSEVEFANRVIRVFAEAGEAGTVGLDGQMLDIPHLVQAQKVLALHEAFGGN